MSDTYLLRAGISLKQARKKLKEIKKNQKTGETTEKTTEEETAEEMKNQLSAVLTGPAVNRLLGGSLTEPVACTGTQNKEKTKNSKKSRKAAEKNQVTENNITPVAQVTGVSTEEFNAKCLELQRANREIEKHKGRISELEDEVRRLTRNNNQLKTTISNTSRNAKNTDVTQLKAKVESLESANSTLQHEVKRYQLLVEQAGIDVNNISAKDTLFAILTSPVRLHCTVLENRRYTVQFGSRFKKMRFIPDDDGEVECINGDVDLPALGAYSAFEPMRKIPVTVENGVIQIAD